MTSFKSMAEALAEIEWLNGEARGYNSMLETLTVNNSKLHAENEQLTTNIVFLAGTVDDQTDALDAQTAEIERLRDVIYGLNFDHPDAARKASDE